MAVIKYKNLEGDLVELPIMINYTPKTAYDLAVECGFSGTIEEWLESLKGILTKDSIEGLLTGDINTHTHPASIIAEDSNHRFITDTERGTWNNKISVESYPFIQNTVSDANTFITNGYKKTTPTTTNLPTDMANWGIIQCVMENLSSGTGTQLYYITAGTYKGYMYVRSVENKGWGQWYKISTFSGSYNDLTDKPTISSDYTLPIATATTLGGIKVGTGLNIADGVLNTTGSGVADSIEWDNVQNKPNVATQDYVNTNINSLQKLQISQTEPIDTSVKLWIDDSENITTTLAILNDSLESSDNVWSSSKTMRSVNEVETRLTEMITTHSHPNRLVTVDIVDTVLNLTTDRYQTTTMITGTTIVLPTVTSFTEIYLFFKADSDLILSLPSCKWQNIPTIKSGKYYELVFTYTTEWIGGVIVYG